MTLRITVLLAILCMALPGSAASQSRGAEKGRPFQALQAAIDQNASEIDANAAAISGLSSTLAGISVQIGDINNALNEISAAVLTNSADIDAALWRITANEGGIGTLQDDLEALSARHASDLADLTIYLDGIDGQIGALTVANSNLAQEMSARVAELRGLIDDNTAAITSNLVDIVLLNARVSTNTTAIQAMQTWRDFVDTQLSSHAGQLSNLDAALTALKDRVNNYHCQHAVGVGSTVTGTLDVSDCTSDSRGPTYAAQYYQFSVSATRTVTIDMLGTGGYMSCSGGGTLSDPYLYLHQGGRSGAVLASNDDAGCGFNARLVISLSPGTYTIEATSFAPGQLGTFVLSLQ